MGIDKTSLGDRMKEYEAVSQSRLMRRTPIIIRIDGRAFHTFTKKLVADKPFIGHETAHQIVDPTLADGPFSHTLHTVMMDTAAVLHQELQTSVFVYTQSDEISILLKDWDKHETQQWFGGNLQKIVSLSSSIATAAFNHWFDRETNKTPIWFKDLAQFDARAFNIPVEEVTNYFIWRQQDASRNSVQMYGHFHFSQKEMHGKNNNQVQDMLMEQKGVNWNDCETWKKRGSCVYDRDDWTPVQSSPRAIIDDNIPIFTQDRQFIEKHLTPIVKELEVA